MLLLIFPGTSVTNQKISQTIAFLHLSPPLLNPDGSTAITSVSKAELFSQTLPLNSTLEDSGHIPTIHLSSDFTMLGIKIHKDNVLCALSGLNFPKAYGSDGVPFVVLKKNVLPC